ncbi:MAG: hypothetical protein R3B13_29950 [Polyangiaceae bacterium]
MRLSLWFGGLVVLTLPRCLESLPEAVPADAGVDVNLGGTAGDAAGFDVAPDTTTEAGAGTGGSGGSGGSSGAGGDAGDLCGDTSPVGYEIFRVPTGVSITPNAFCGVSDPTFNTAPALPLKLKAGAFSDNNPTCKLLWSPDQDPPVLWACCDVDDKDVRAAITVDDAANIWLDDSVEFLVKENDTPALSTSTLKLFVNANQIYRDTRYDGSLFDANYDANVVPFAKLILPGTRNDTIPDKGYSIKFRVNLPFSVVPGQKSRCDLAVHDADLIDGGLSVTGHVAFSGKSTPDLSGAGVCRFSCKSP